ARRDIALPLIWSDRRGLVAGAVVVFVSLVLLTFPVEPHRLWAQHVLFPKQSDCFVPANALTRLLRDVDRLSVNGEIAVDPDKVAKIKAAAADKRQPLWKSERTRHFDHRDLSCGSFVAADPRLADFTRATMIEAKLDGADLEGAKFDHATLREADLYRADLH